MQIERADLLEIFQEKRTIFGGTPLFSVQNRLERKVPFHLHKMFISWLLALMRARKKRRDFFPPLSVYQWDCRFETENEALRLYEKSLSFWHGKLVPKYQTKNSADFGIKLNGKVRSNWKISENRGPPLKVVHFFRFERLVRWLAY